MKKTATALLILAPLLAPGTAFAGGMPQLDFANPLLLAQLVWGAFIFAVFYAAVSVWGLPKVGAILEMRASTISSDLEQAQLAKEKSDRAIAELNEARRLAYAESQAAVATAAAKAKDEAAAQAAVLNAKLDAQLAAAEATITAARRGAMAAIGSVATQTAQTIVGRLTGRVPEDVEIAASVRGVLADRGLAA